MIGEGQPWRSRTEATAIVIQWRMEKVSSGLDWGCDPEILRIGKRSCRAPPFTRITADRGPTVHDILLRVDDHPLLRVAAFVTTFPAALGTVPTPPGALEALRL